jgi:acetyl esterase
MTNRTLAMAGAAISLLFAACGGSRPAWIPAGYQWQSFSGEGGRSLAVAWPVLTDRRHRPLALLVHGGGWSGGRPDEMLPVARMILELGYLPVLVQYRRLGEAATLDDSVADLRSAWDHVVDRSASLGGTVEGSMVIGGSAGGHLALYAFGAREDLVESPRSLLLLCHVLDTSPERGFGGDQLGEDWPRWSPRHAPMRIDLPTLVLHGSDDAIIPLGTTRQAVEAMNSAGGKVRLSVLEGLSHGFYARPAELEQACDLIAVWCDLEASSRLRH